jgi:Domain of unknown function (DUF4340)
MKSKGLLTASFLLLVLSGIIWWSNKKAATAEKTPIEKTATSLISIPEDQFQEIEIRKRGGEVVQLRRVDSQWQIAGAKLLRADPDATSSLLSSLSSLSSDRTVEEKSASLDQYGLTQPAIELDITDKNLKTAKILIGDKTPAGTAVYAAIAGDSRVFAVSSYKTSNFDKFANDLRDKRMLVFDTDKLSRVELQAKKENIEFGRDKDRWQIVKPTPLRADQSAVEELLRTLHDAKMDLSGGDDAKKVAAAFQTGSGGAIARVADTSGMQELQVRKSKDDYYAKSSAVEGIYKIASNVGTGLDKSLDDFRNKKLFDFGYADPEKVEIHDGPKSYLLSRSSSDWLSNGTKLDPASATTLIGQIRDLTATKFANHGFTTPVLDLTVTSDNGKRTEKVLISKDGDHFLAKRDGEAALYELAVSAVQELQTSAADLKPAAPAKK